MTAFKTFLRCLILVMTLSELPWASAQYTPQQSVFTAHNFEFHDGTTLPTVNLAYSTLGDPSQPAVLVLHGTNGSGTALLNADFGGQIFGPGQPFDAAKYFIVLPDALGAGRSSKPSDGMAARFPQYNYHDMVRAFHLLMTQGLRIPHVRAVLGYSMGGMHTWMMGTMHPEFADILIPMAAMPIAMSGRNWMTRRLLIDTIRNDPDYQGGFYTRQPRSAHVASVMYSIATNGGANGLQHKAPTRELADHWLEQAMKAPFTSDANDLLYQFNASRDFAPEPDLHKIKATVLMINSTDDERNPPELEQTRKVLPRIPHLTVYLIPGSEQTLGHSTAGQARWWAEQTRAVLQHAPAVTPTP
jgi:homoserine O-acetyltransferase/O-succinyltransferase